MVNFTLLAGGSTTFIASYLFNSDASSLTLLHQNPTGPNPSWIGLHPTNTSILYAVNEVEQGAVQSFAIGVDGLLAGPLSNVSSGGNGPAHLQALSTGEVSVMNFGGANGRIVGTTEDPAVFTDTAPVISFPAIKSNPHETLELANGELLVPDLGADKIWRLSKAANGSFGITGSIDQPAGSGPRHIAVVGDLLFTLHELSSTLTAQNLSAADPSALLSNLTTIPSTASPTAKFGAAEILIPPPSSQFPGTLIYCSNRNISPDPKDVDPAGDTIAIFSVDAQGKLTLEKQVPTGVTQPRGLAFSGGGAANSTASATDTRAFSISGAGTAEFVAVGGQSGTAGVAIFRRTEGGRNLVEVAREKTVPTRTSFVWL